MQPIGQADAQPQPDELLRRDRAGRLPHRPPRARASSSPTTRCCRRGNFSYLDTQLTRLGGPNFTQIPINRPHAPVNDNYRDGFHQQAVHEGVAPYLPNTRRRRHPVARRRRRAAATSTSRGAVRGGEASARARRPSTTTSRQAALFYASLAEPEKEHIIEAYTFELGKVLREAIKERALAVLAKIDAELCEKVAAGLGLPAPKADPVDHLAPVPGAVAGRPGRPARSTAGPSASSPARTPTWPASPRCATALEAAGAVPQVIAPRRRRARQGRPRRSSSARS